MRLSRRTLWILFGFVIIAQLVVLYWPRVDLGMPPTVGLDKVIHFGIFAVPAMLAILLGMGPWKIGAVLAVHAVASEILQELLLPSRSGDWLDAVADLLGVAVGTAIGIAVLNRQQRALER